MASSRIVVAKMLRTRVVDIASAMRMSPPSELRVVGAEHVKDAARRQALFESLTSAAPPPGCDEHMIIMPRAAAEEVFGLGHVEPATAAIGSRAPVPSLGSSSEEHTAEEVFGLGHVEPATAAIGSRAPVPSLGSSSEEHTGALTPAQQDQTSDSLVSAASILPTMSLSAIAAQRNNGAQLQSLRRTASVKHEHRRGPPLPDEIQQVFYAAEIGDADDLRKRVANCADADINMPHPVHGGTCLHAVAGLPEAPDSAEECVAILCEAGAKVDARAGNQSTPLHWAAGAGNVGVVRALLKHGADPELTSSTWKSNVFGKGSGQTAAHWAAESGHLDCVEVILANAPLASFLEDERGQSPTDLAIKEGHDELLPVLEAAQASEMVCLAISTESTMHQVLGSGFENTVQTIGVGA